MQNHQGPMWTGTFGCCFWVWQPCRWVHPLGAHGAGRRGPGCQTHRAGPLLGLLGLLGL